MAFLLSNIAAKAAEDRKKKQGQPTDGSFFLANAASEAATARQASRAETAAQQTPTTKQQTTIGKSGSILGVPFNAPKDTIPGTSVPVNSKRGEALASIIDDAQKTKAYYDEVRLNPSKYAKAENADEIRRQAKEAQAYLKNAGQYIDTVSGMKTDTQLEDYLRAIEKAQSWYDLDKNEDYEQQSQYAQKYVPGTEEQLPDWEEKSRYAQKYMPGTAKPSAWNGSYYGPGGSTGSEDIVYDYINRRYLPEADAEKVRGIMAVNEANSGLTYKGYENLPENTVKAFNYIYATKGKDEAYKFLNSVADPGMLGAEALGLGAIQGSGALSLATAAAKAIGDVTGNEETKQSAQDMYNDLMLEIQQANKTNPEATAFGRGVASTALLLAMSYGIGAIPGLATVGEGAGAVGNIAGNALRTAATFGTSSLIQNIGGAAASDDPLTAYTELLKNVTTSSMAGAAGGAASGAIGAAGTNFLLEHNLYTNALARKIVGGLGSLGFTAGTQTVEQSAAFLNDPKNYKMDGGQILESAVTQLAFSVLAGIGNDIDAEEAAATQDRWNAARNATRISSAEQELAQKYFGGMTEAEAKAEYRRLAKMYHPDTGNGDTAIMSEITQAYDTVQKYFASLKTTTASTAYADMQTAKQNGDTEGYKNALALLTESVEDLNAYYAENGVPSQDVADALAIVNRVVAAQSPNATPATVPVGSGTTFPPANVPEGGAEGIVPVSGEAPAAVNPVAGTQTAATEGTGTIPIENAAESLQAAQSEAAQTEPVVTPSVTPELQRDAMAAMQRAASNSFGKAGAEAAMSAYDPQSAVGMNDYLRDFARTYNAALEGGTATDTVLTAEQYNAAIQAANADRAEALQTAPVNATMETEQTAQPAAEVTPYKQAQFEALQNADVTDEWNEPITSAAQIKTYAEAVEADRAEFGSSVDFDIEAAEQALSSGEITVYSPRAISAGSFVTPSRVNAEDMAGGGGRIYSMTVPLDAVAWTDAWGGQYTGEMEGINNGRENGLDTRSAGDISQRAGESGRAVPEGSEGARGERGAGSPAQRAGEKGGVHEVDAQELFRTAKPGQTVRTRSEPTESTRNAFRLAEKNGVKDFITFENEIETTTAEKSIRAYNNPSTGQIGVQENNPYVEPDDLARHEIMEHFLDTGKVRLSDIVARAAEILGDGGMSRLNQAADIYFRAMKPKGRTLSASESSRLQAHAASELVCDGADHINQLLPAVEKGRTDLAGLKVFLDEVLDALNGAANELTGGAFELEGSQAAVNENGSEAKENATPEKGGETALGETRFSSKITPSQKRILDLDIAWDPDENSSIKEQLLQHIDEVKNMEPATSVNYDRKTSAPYYKVLDDILKDRFGYKISREDGISFLFDSKAIKSIRQYIESDAEAAAAIAAPYVVKRGKIISGHKHHKGGLYPSITIAAPAALNNNTGITAVTILFADKDRVHSLRVLTPDGKEFELQKNEADPKTSGDLAKARQTISDESASKPTVPQSGKSVKTEFSSRLPEIDSYGAVLSPEQMEYFAESKARDDEGRLLVLYHGGSGRTVYGGRGKGFTYQQNAIFLTDSPEVARAFAGQHGTVQRLYANVTNPLVLDAEGRNYTDIPIPKNSPQSLKDYFWYDNTADMDNLSVYASEHGYDGIIVHNVREGVGGDPMTEVVAFDSNQVKLDTNEKPTKDPDVRFSMQLPVEETKDLIALHNLSSTNLSKALELGGFPMPSIAVTRTDIPHTNFGDITLVMDKNTIDPQADKRNTVYSADAWTPTFPGVEYEADEAVESRLLKKFTELRNKYGRENVDALYSYANLLSDELTRYGGIAGIIEREKNNTDMKKVYLLDTGKTVPEPIKKETVTRLRDDQIALYDSLINALDSKILDEAKTLAFSQVREFYGEYEAEIKAAFRQFYIDHGATAADADAATEATKPGQFVAPIKNAARYIESGPETRKTETDYAATEKAINDSVDQTEYEAWLADLFEGAEKQSGIYNGKDYYTSSGNRRSFSATHFPVTLDNIARAMAAVNGGNSRNVDGFYGVKSLRAGMAKRFASIAEMHEYEGRLQHLTEEQAEKINDALAGRLNNVLNEIYDTRTHGQYDNMFIEMDHIGQVLMEVTEQKKITVDSIVKAFSEYGYKISNATAADVRDLLFDISEMPVNIYEAKPERAVRFNEVLAAIVPTGTDEALLNRLRAEGVQNILEYEAGNDEDRLAKVNSVEGASFSSALDPEALEEQNEQLRKDLQAATAALARAQSKAAYWEGQTKRSKAPSPNPTDINRLAHDIVSNTDTNLKGKDIAPELTELAEFIMRGGNGTEELTFSGVKERAVGIAHRMLENYSELRDSSAVTDYKDIRGRLRNYGTIQVPGNDLPPDWTDWKRRNGWLRVAVSKGTPLDLVYKDLSASYPWIFPEDANPGSDQLYALVDGVRAAEPAYWNPNDEMMAVATEYLANQIIDGIIEDVAQDKTFADKMAKKLQDQKYDAAQKLEATKAELRAAVQQTRARADERLNNLKAHYKEVQETARARKAEGNMRTRLLKIAKRLQDKKLPTPSRALVNEYVGYIDTVAKNMTGKTRDKLQALSELYNYELENNPDFTRDEAIEKKLSRLNAVRISDLTVEQVQDLIDVLLGLEHQLNNAKRELDSADRRDVYQKGVQIIDDVKGGHTVKPQYMETLDNLFVRNTLSPLREIRRQTGYVDGDPLYEAGLRLNRGQLRMNDYVMKNSKTFDEWVQDKAFMESLTGKKAKTIKVRGAGMNGQPVTVEITPDMRISLYLHNKNLQNQQHISSMSGGVKVPDMKLYRAGKIAEAYAKGTRIRLQPSEIRAVCENMTAKERALAERIYKYFNTTSRNALSDEFERLKGYMMRFVEDYFPIDTDGSFTKANAEAINFDGSLEGSGWLKERVVNAKNPIMLYDATSVLLKAIQAHGQFVGLAVPIRDFTKLYGMNGPVYDEAKNRIGSQSVKETIKQTWGTGATDYIDKMLGDLQKTHTESNSWTDLFRQIRSNYAGATLALNLSVALKQAGSYPTAAAVLGWKPLARAMADFGKVDLDYIASLTPLQWLRSQGYSTPELGDLKAKGRQLPPALNWIQGMDLLTTRKLWKACEYYMQENHPDLKRGSDQYNGTISELYNRVIEETQPNYTVMQRPQLLRSNNELIRDVSMFKTQLFQNFNIFYDAFGNMAAKHQQYQANPNAETKAKYEEAKKNAGRASAALIVQSVVIAAMTLAWNALRGKLKRYKDEEKDKITGWSFAKRFGLDVASGFFSMVPFGSEVFSMISSKLTGEKWYGFEGVTTGALTDFFSTLMTAVDQIGKSLDAAKGSNTAAIQKQVLAWEDIAENTAKVFGVPAENVMNLIKAVYGSITKTACGKYYGEYLAMLATTPIENNKGKYYDLLYNAEKSGNMDQFWEIYNSMVALDAMASEKKSTVENIDAALKQREKKDK